MNLEKEVFELNINDIMPNRFQPREIFDEQALNELALSIKEHGVIQPIIVRKNGDKYEIIAGERRYRASKLAGLETIPAIIRDFTDEQMMEIALLENLQRENLNAIEEALAYKSMIDKLGITQDELSKKVGKSRSHVTNMLGLLRLPEDVKEMVANKKISMGHARMISKLENSKEMSEMANKIYNEGLSVRQTENLGNDPKVEKKNKISKKENTISSEYKYVENLLREKLDAKVKISDKKLEIYFTSMADLNRILETLDIKE